MATTKKTPTKKATAKKATAKKATAKKAAAKKTSTRRVEDPVARRAAARKRRERRAEEPGLPPGEMLTMEIDLPAPPDVVYDAWLDAEEHARMTNAKATGAGERGAEFSTHDGYASGVYLELFPKERIVMAFRTREFGDAPDSLLDLLMSPAIVDGVSGTRLFLIHTSLPEGGASKYARFWAEEAFAPMTTHFERRLVDVP